MQKRTTSLNVLFIALIAVGLFTIGVILVDAGLLDVVSDRFYRQPPPTRAEMLDALTITKIIVPSETERACKDIDAALAVERFIFHPSTLDRPIEFMERYKLADNVTTELYQRWIRNATIHVVSIDWTDAIMTLEKAPLGSMERLSDACWTSYNIELDLIRSDVFRLAEHDAAAAEAMMK